MTALFWGCLVMNYKDKPPFQWNDVSMLRRLRKRQRRPLHHFQTANY